MILIDAVIAIARYRIALLDITNFFPFSVGHSFHDYHHMAFEGNFGSTFAFWDYICGTDKDFRAIERVKQKNGEAYWCDTIFFLSQFFQRTTTDKKIK